MQRRETKEQCLKPCPVIEIAPGRNIGGHFPCFIIAEIGQNHQGDIGIAKQLIEIAVDSGVDCVKFQKSDLKSRFTKEVLKRPYQSKNSWGETYGEHRTNLELTDDDFEELKQYSDKLGIYFTASGMDKPSVEFLERLGVPFFKIGSADTTNLPLLRHISKYQKPLVISTGMTNKVDLCKMYREISEINKSIVLLQCTSCYPTLPCNVNLNVIETYSELFPLSVIGYSGHEVGTEISLAAVAAGAKILERHITIDHSLKGSDHISSLNPKELKHLVQEIRTIEEALGSHNKEVQDCELPCFEKLGKTIVATRFLKRESILLDDMIDIKVAVKKGFDPIHFDDLIGKKLTRDLEEEDTVFPNDVL